LSLAFFNLFFRLWSGVRCVGSLADRRVPIPVRSIRFGSVRFVYRKTNTWPGTRRWPFAVRYVTHGWLSGSWLFKMQTCRRRSRSRSPSCISPIGHWGKSSI